MGHLGQGTSGVGSGRDRSEGGGMGSFWAGIEWGRRQNQGRRWQVQQHSRAANSYMYLPLSLSATLTLLSPALAKKVAQGQGGPL